ncbi:ABC transporter substrate-binding protein [Streptomyces sp. NBC_00878]|uniref:ABC transporter substrate-binding protein n=1 Tax=Streptomyces sp. NBC_00878 TaxID=2975854 RepID=UPI002259F49F|nr:ABC transporter substrate-binding protein [Streptomyces sp. NBC_00878]MCX4903855.1 ABC transporter substrate-binding protein [Streptomyces sp. NBC_00878]
MRLSRRGLLRAGLAGTAATALGGLASGCAVPTGSTGRNMVLWYWSGGLSDTVVKKAKSRYDDSTVRLEAIQIGGYYRSKLITTMTGQAHVPDIAGLKGEDMASYLPNASQFIDLRTLGAEKFKSQYLDWKWQQGVAPDGSLVGFPIDVGPVVQFYQPAVYEKAGLAYEPDDVSKEMGTWDQFFTAGEQLKKRIPGSFILTDVASVFEMSIGQGTKRYVDEDQHFIGDQEHVRTAWDRAVEAKRRGLVSSIVSGTPDWNSASERGLLPSQINASWAAGDIKLGLPKTKGKWRVANCPGGPSNVGGSFLAITKACREPEKAFEIITWLLNADNQAQGFVDAGLFPSTPASYEMKQLRDPDPFFGGQATMDVYGPAAEKIPVAFNSPFDVALGQPIKDEIKNVGVLGKDPKKAWRDAMSKCRRIADHLGVSF